MIGIDINCDDFNKHCLNIFLEKKLRRIKQFFFSVILIPNYWIMKHKIPSVNLRILYNQICFYYIYNFQLE